MPKLEIEINDEAYAYLEKSAQRNRRSIEDEIGVGLEGASKSAAMASLGLRGLSSLLDDDDGD